MEGGAELAHPVNLGPAPWFQVDDKFIRQGPYGHSSARFGKALVKLLIAAENYRALLKRMD
jgi:hypothetical protein